MASSGLSSRKKLRHFTRTYEIIRFFLVREKYGLHQLFSVRGNESMLSHSAILMAFADFADALVHVLNKAAHTIIRLRAGSQGERTVTDTEPYYSDIVEKLLEERSPMQWRKIKQAKDELLEALFQSLSSPAYSTLKKVVNAFTEDKNNDPLLNTLKNWGDTKANFYVPCRVRVSCFPTPDSTTTLTIRECLNGFAAIRGEIGHGKMVGRELPFWDAIVIYKALFFIVDVFASVFSSHLSLHLLRPEEIVAPPKSDDEKGIEEGGEKFSLAINRDDCRRLIQDQCDKLAELCVKMEALSSTKHQTAAENDVMASALNSIGRVYYLLRRYIVLTEPSHLSIMMNVSGRTSELIPTIQEIFGGNEDGCALLASCSIRSHQLCNDKGTCCVRLPVGKQILTLSWPEIYRLSLRFVSFNTLLANDGAQQLLWHHLKAIWQFGSPIPQSCRSSAEVTSFLKQRKPYFSDSQVLLEKCGENPNETSLKSQAITQLFDDFSLFLYDLLCAICHRKMITKSEMICQWLLQLHITQLSPIQLEAFESKFYISLGLKCLSSSVGISKIDRFLKLLFGDNGLDYTAAQIFAACAQVGNSPMFFRCLKEIRHWGFKGNVGPTFLRNFLNSDATAKVDLERTTSPIGDIEGIFRIISDIAGNLMGEFERGLKLKRGEYLLNSKNLRLLKFERSHLSKGYRELQECLCDSELRRAQKSAKEMLPIVARPPGQSIISAICLMHLAEKPPKLCASGNNPSSLLSVANAGIEYAEKLAIVCRNLQRKGVSRHATASSASPVPLEVRDLCNEAIGVIGQTYDSLVKFIELTEPIIVATFLNGTGEGTDNSGENCGEPLLRCKEFLDGVTSLGKPKIWDCETVSSVLVSCSEKTYSHNRQFDAFDFPLKPFGSISLTYREIFHLAVKVKSIKIGFKAPAREEDDMDNAETDVNISETNNGESEAGVKIAKKLHVLPIRILWESINRNFHPAPNSSV